MVPLRYQISLLQGLVDGRTARIGPFFTTISVTDRCNIRCIGCFYHCTQRRRQKILTHQFPDLSLRLVDKLSRQLPSMGAREIFLAGEGEPMLHPRLWDIIRCFKKKGLRITLFSNGTLLHEENARRLIDSGLDVLKISFWAVNDWEYNLCHPGIDPQLLEGRIKHLRYLAELKNTRHLVRPEINLQLIINRYNHENLTDRLKLAKMSGCNSISFSVFRDYGGVFQGLSLTSVDVTELRPKLTRAKKALSSLGIDCNEQDYLLHADFGYSAWKQVPCFAGWFQTAIRTDGVVLACPHCHKSMGNINEQDLAAIWDGTAYREFRKKGLERGGLMVSPFGCDCSNCCLVKDNLRVYSRLKWIEPAFRLYGKIKRRSR